jgi:Flp pilus assembly protein CpaB
MRKIIIKIISLSIIMLMLLLAEHVIALKSNEKTNVRTVFVAARSISVGSQLNMDMLKAVEIPEHLLSEHIVTEQVEGFLLSSVQAGEFLYKHQIASRSPLHIDTSERLITIKCTMIESNGWAFQLNDTVDIIMVDLEGSIVLKNAVVSRIFDEDLNSASIPEYLSVIVSEEDAMRYYNKVSNARVFISHKSQEGL